MCSAGSSSDGEEKYFFAIDRGGTFTDVLCICPGGRVRTIKLLSEDPERYSDAPREGIRRILKEVSSLSLKQQQPWKNNHMVISGNWLRSNALWPGRYFKDWMGTHGHDCGH